MTRLVEEKCKLVNERLHLAVSVAIAASRQRLDPIVGSCTNLANCGALYLVQTTFYHSSFKKLFEKFLDVFFKFL